MTVGLLAVAGALGAVVRAMAGERWPPWGVVAVNVAGSFVLGLVVGAEAGRSVRLVVGVGFCGALTTFSTFAYHVTSLERGRRSLYAAASVVGALLAAALGLALA